MIEFLSPGILLTCNTVGCESTVESTEWTDFQEFINDAKADGWRMRFVEGEWEHYCPDCSDEERRHGN